ncbi:hypothetical protein B0H14DRAFT_2568141 [Mycena olivaceomarginata]|nr:hypothetical protein B0H14DRAFT_2568141 [Mycena olivaceomarginata]
MTAKGIMPAKEGQFDTVLVRKDTPDPDHHPIHGISVARIRVIFRLPEHYGSYPHPLAYVDWYKPLKTLFLTSECTRFRFHPGITANILPSYLSPRSFVLATSYLALASLAEEQRRLPETHSELPWLPVATETQVRSYWGYHHVVPQAHGYLANSCLLMIPSHLSTSASHKKTRRAHYGHYISDDSLSDVRRESLFIGCHTAIEEVPEDSSVSTDVGAVSMIDPVLPWLFVVVVKFCMLHQAGLLSEASALQWRREEPSSRRSGRNV